MDFGIALAPGVDAWKVVERAERLGFTHAWFYDTQMLCADVFVAMALAAAHTAKIVLGTGVLVPSNRIAPVAANALASLNGLAPGRIVFGVSTGFTARNTMGLGPMRLAELREYVRVVQALLEGETVEWAFEGARRKIRFLNPEAGLVDIAHPIPLHLSAFAPKARALTAEIADGWMNFVTVLPAALHEVEEMGAACRAAGRTPASLYKTGFTLGCVLREGEDAASPRARAQAGPLVPVMFHAFLERTVDPERLAPDLGAAVKAFRAQYETYTPPDPACGAADPDDFPAMIEPGRYARRSSDFEEIIARTEEHFWNPEDPDYVDFAAPFPTDQDTIVPTWFVLESNTAVWDRLDDGQRIKLTNQSARWSLSNILHGEQGALSLSASLCDIFLDPGAQEYAANQAREEARHVHAFARYMAARFGGAVFPVGDTVGRLLGELVATPVVYKKIVGMQMLVEGVAMGAFTTLYKIAQDPLLRRVCQLVMTDEAFHHKFGKIWAHATIPQLDGVERDAVEDWALECFNTLLFNLVNPEQKRLIYPEFGLDWQWVRDAVLEARTDAHRRSLMQRGSNVFRTLIKTLLKAGIITERTRAAYALWVDLDELAAEGDRMVGDEVAEEGIKSLKEINAGKRKVVRRLGA